MLPSSPSARAFFQALDNEQQHNSIDSDTKKKRENPWIRKQMQTLGWRNRYSQCEYYPLEISNNNNNRNNNNNSNNNNSSNNNIKFQVKQVQRGEVENSYGTGATVWPAAVVLCKYLERHAPTCIQNKRVIDLGTGTAITSIAAAILGASLVVSTDGEESVVQLALENVQRVAASTSTEIAGWPPIVVQKYWWGSDTAELYTHQQEEGEQQEQPRSSCYYFDVILVSDCVLPKLYPIAPLVEALDQLLIQPEAIAMLSYEHRYFPDYDPREKFRELAALKQLHVHIVPLSEQDPIYSVDDIEIWQVSRNTAITTTTTTDTNQTTTTTVTTIEL